MVLAGVPSSSSSLDRTLMDMCRSLEEENSTLTSSMDQLKRRLAAAEEEIAKNNLIPHYRLAIVRARSYTANLLEQLKREQVRGRGGLWSWSNYYMCSLRQRV